MVNGQYANIIDTTPRALSAKSLDDFNLALPVASLLVYFVSMSIPVLLLAFWATKTCGSRISTLNTRIIVIPAMSLIAVHTTILCTFGPIGRNIKRLFAMLTYKRNLSILSHTWIIQPLWAIVKPGYFDIAKSRIEKAQLEMVQGKFAT